MSKPTTPDDIDHVLCSYGVDPDYIQLTNGNDPITSDRTDFFLDDEITGSHDPNPCPNAFTYDVAFIDSETKEYSANVISEKRCSSRVNPGFNS